MLIPRKSQVWILPNNHFQLARYCLVWGIRSISSPTTVELNESLILILSVAARPTIYVCFYCFVNDMQVPKLNADDQEAKVSQCDA